MKPTPSLAFSFRTERFEYKADIPAEYNAGNRFYGRDVAQFISTRLTELGIVCGFLDEDWGWLVFSDAMQVPMIEIAVYNLSDHREGGRPGSSLWGLWLRAYVKGKWLGFIPRRIEVPFPAGLAEQVRGIFVAEGIPLSVWDEDQQA